MTQAFAGNILFTWAEDDVPLHSPGGIQLVNARKPFRLAQVASVGEGVASFPYQDKNRTQHYQQPLKHTKVWLANREYPQVTEGLFLANLGDIVAVEDE